MKIVFLVLLFISSLITSPVAVSQTTDNCVVPSGFGMQISENQYWFDLLCQPTLLTTLEIEPDISILVTIDLQNYYNATGNSTAEFDLHFAMQQARLRVIPVDTQEVSEIADETANIQGITVTTSAAFYEVVIENVGLQSAIFDLSVRPAADPVSVAALPEIAEVATDTPVATNTSPPPTAAPAQTYYTTGSANLRICPRVADDCRVAATVAGGAALTVVGEIDGSVVSGSPTWHILDHNGQRLYIHSSLVTRQQPAPAQPAQPIQPAQPAQPAEPAPPAAPAAACVDINTADHATLQQIIHIGPDRATQIINLRPFRSVDDMTRISGIAAARLRDIKNQGLACVR
jgi:DNA uptake protein ComE-like DNA-binding protein